MRWRVFLFVSLGVNVVLAAAWLVSAHRRATATANSTNPGQRAATLSRTNLPVIRQFFTWQEVESPDYPTYIANLRDIGCPEQTIRDIIIADVNALYARKRATEVLTSEQQWWRTNPDPAVLRAAVEKLRALDEERRALLTRLLGPNWEAGDLANLPRPSRPGVALDGPVLGALPADVKEAVQDASARAQDRLQAYLASLDGKNPDPAEIARLRQQTRDELARVLSPEQLEEFLLRYSQDANDLRAELGQLHYFNVTSNEFRSIFRATDSLDQQIALLAGSIDPNSIAQRDALEQQRQNAIKLALGPERYQEYQQLHDPLYQQAVASAQQAGDPGAVQTLYEINLATADELNSIRANTNLTPEEMAVQLKQAELDQLKANMQALGQSPPLPPAPPPMFSHSVIFGETLSSISQIYNVPVSAIREANPNFDFSRMKAGDSIRIPQATPAPQAQ